MLFLHLKKASYLRPFFLLSFFFLVVIYSVSPWFGYYIDVTGFNEQRLLQIGVYFVAVICILFAGVKEISLFCNKSFSKKSLVALLVVILSAVLTSFFAEYSWRSFQDVFIYVSVLLSALMIGHALQGVPEKDVFAFVSVITLVAVGIFFIHFSAYYSFFLFYPGEITAGEIPRFSNVRIFNHLQVLIFPLLVNAFVVLKDKRVKALTFFFCAFWMCLFFYTGARGALLSLVLGVALQWFVGGYSASFYFKHYISIVLAGIALYLAVFEILPYFLSEDLPIRTVLRSGSSGRVELWLLALTKGFGCLPLGCGGQSFVNFTTLYHPFPFGTPHNVIFHLFVEYGPVTVVLFCFGAFGYLKYSMSRKESSSNVLSLITAVTVYLIYSLFSGVYASTISLILLPVILGCLLALKMKSREKEVLSRDDRWLSFIIVSLSLMLFLLGFMVVLSDLTNVLNEISGGSMFPRFWSNGGVFIR